ncbi:hypothetical protein MKZ24_31545 [Paenibacillus sp. FSL R7-0297]|uniref:hypothetical protein n=1 Tax=unclassified Paenibacillus TaxID=185978 RepID=UPI0030F76573
MNFVISVMLVDDEPLALENVYDMVPWAEHGFEVVAKATSGRMRCGYSRNCSRNRLLEQLRKKAADMHFKFC